MQRGRLSDAIVVARPRRPGGDELQRAPAGRTVEEIMRGTGRPLLIVPPEAESVVPPGPVRRIAIGWNASQESARAITQSIPWLEQMEAVTLIVAERRREAADAVVDYLAWHGVEVAVRVLGRGQRSAAVALLDVCAELRADILVVGGFSRSRARRLLFGGVTGHLLTQASLMTLMVA